MCSVAEPAEATLHIVFVNLLLKQSCVKPCSSPCSQLQRRDEACRGNASQVINSSHEVRALSRRHAINPAAVTLKPTTGCITDSSEQQQRAYSNKVHFEKDESCLSVQSLAKCYPRDVPAAPPDLDASSKVTLTSLLDLLDPTSGILSLVPTDTIVCYSSGGLHSLRELAVIRCFNTWHLRRKPLTSFNLWFQLTSCTPHPPPSHYQTESSSKPVVLISCTDAREKIIKPQIQGPR